ncbi:MAG: TPM domain-containing protein [Salibacteraceae bacterium]
MSLAKSFLSKSEQQKVIEAIKEAEKNSSGEIRLHIEDECKEDLMDHASFIFEKLEMHKTDLRNGVLFYVSLNPHGFAILGDAGINQKVADDFWDSTKDLVIENFKKGQYATGLAKGIRSAGEQLKQYFPYQTDDVNELSDDISFGSKQG